MSPIKRRPVWRSAEPSSGASASALDGPDIALRLPFRGGGTSIMDISIAARVSRALMFVSCATGVDASSHQYHAQGTNNIADRPATDGPIRRARRLIVATRRPTRPAGRRFVEAQDKRLRFPGRLLRIPPDGLRLRERFFDADR